MMERAVAVHNSSSVSELGSFVMSRPGELDANLGELSLSNPSTQEVIFWQSFTHHSRTLHHFSKSCYEHLS